MKYFLLVASVVALLMASSGCLNLKPVADPTRNFVLSPVAVPAESPAPNQSVGVGLRAPLIPSYLNDKRLAVRKGPQEIAFLQWFIWAERLDRSILRVLGHNIGLQLPTDNVQLLDWTREDVQFEVEFGVDRFESDSQGLVTLDVVWRIVEPGTSRILRADRTRLQKPGPDPAASPDGTVAIMSELLAEFSQLLADQMRGVPQSPAARWESQN